MGPLPSGTKLLDVISYIMLSLLEGGVDKEGQCVGPVMVASLVDSGKGDGR